MAAIVDRVSRPAWLCAIGLLVACVGPGDTLAQDAAADFPSRNITLIVPFGAGGPPDVLARVVAGALSEELGKPVIVENRPGASTAIAATAVARAAPDGHTLMAIDLSFVVTPHIASNLSVDPMKDFKLVGQSARSVFVLITSPSLKAPTIGEFLKLARSNPETVKIAHTGIGTTPHLAAVTFLNATKLDLLLVPYRTVSNAVSDLIVGHIPAVFSTPPAALGLAKEGKVHVLGVTGNERIKSMPDLPTFAENGIQMTGFERGSWYGIAAPAGTPDAIVAKLNAALNKAVRNKEARDKMAKSEIHLQGGTPEEFRDFVTSHTRGAPPE
jgi:tripartite-type tricarboxylate transporter receptor subunit TctC